MPIPIPEKAATAWIHDFNSSELTYLVRQAVDKNYNLLAASARVRSAGARVRISGADRYPQLSISQDSSRSQRLRGVRFQKTISNQFALSADVSWEIDLWGRLERSAKSITRSTRCLVRRLPGQSLITGGRRHQDHPRPRRVENANRTQPPDAQKSTDQP